MDVISYTILYCQELEFPELCQTQTPPAILERVSAGETEQDPVGSSVKFMINLSIQNITLFFVVLLHLSLLRIKEYQEKGGWNQSEPCRPPSPPSTKAPPCRLLLVYRKAESQESRRKPLMIRKIGSQTQCLIHIPELFYRYCNCHQREKANCMMTRLQPRHKLLHLEQF